jgi:hypothetical protein
MRRHLEDLALLVADHCQQIDLNVLWVHVEREAEWQRVLGSGVDLDIVANCRQVTNDGGTWWRALGQLLVCGEGAPYEDDLNWSILLVRNLDERLGRPSIDQLHAEVAVRKGRLDIDLNVDNFGSAWNLVCDGLFESNQSIGCTKEHSILRMRHGSRETYNLVLLRHSCRDRQCKGCKDRKPKGNHGGNTRRAYGKEQTWSWKARHMKQCTRSLDCETIHLPLTEILCEIWPPTRQRSRPLQPAPEGWS